MPTSQRARAGRPWRTLVLVWQHRPCVSLAVQRIPRKGDTSSSKLLVIGEIVILFRRALTDFPKIGLISSTLRRSRKWGSRMGRERPVLGDRVDLHLWGDPTGPLHLLIRSRQREFASCICKLIHSVCTGESRSELNNLKIVNKERDRRYMRYITYHNIHHVYTCCVLVGNLA